LAQFSISIDVAALRALRWRLGWTVTGAIGASGQVMSHRYGFGPFLLDLWRRELRRHEQLVALEPKPFELLRLLVEQRHRVVTRQQILEQVWAGRVVSPGVLPQAVLKLRAVLDEDPAQPWIRGVRGVGYRFQGEVQEDPPSAPPLQRPPEPGGLRLGLLPCLNQTGDERLQWLSLGIPALVGLILDAEPRLQLIGPDPPLAPVEETLAYCGPQVVLEGRLTRQTGALWLHSQLVFADGRALQLASVHAPHWSALCERWAGTVQAALCPGSDAALAPLSPDPFATEAFARGSAWLLCGQCLRARPLLQVAHDLLPDAAAVQLALVRSVLQAGDAGAIPMATALVEHLEADASRVPSSLRAAAHQVLSMALRLRLRPATIDPC
jgi:DNA-binding winged helix-turn-helix (wHTH) protein